MKRCPLCRKEHDTSTRLTGDGLWCSCSALLLVRHLVGGTVLTPSFAVLAPAPAGEEREECEGREEPREVQA